MEVLPQLAFGEAQDQQQISLMALAQRAGCRRDNPRAALSLGEIKRTIRTIAVGVAIGAGWETSDQIKDPPPPVIAPPPPVWLPLAGLP